MITFNNTSNLYTRITTIYSILWRLIKTWHISLNSSRLLINTICSICFIFTSNMTNSSRYLNTTNRTSNCTSCVYSISTTIYRTFLIKACISSFNSSRSILINTIFRNSITNSRIYINTIFRTFNSTIHINTILIIFKWNTLIY